ncbi:hypothetical protein F5Y16DRAFT_361176 [Xylariaceae sp. FL0255]|nr:hypothetical protein F5Y16DRAFT_361176 [Xylariaceae sp. FL0255]
MRLSGCTGHRPLRAASLAFLLLLSPNTACAQGDTDARPTNAPTCESRSVNYITHTLPQQCLTTSPTPTSTPPAVESLNLSTPTAAGEPHDELDSDGEDLSTGAFMSFEEWKAMVVANSGPDALEPRANRNKHRRADGIPGDGFDTLGDEGEISFDFDAYTDKFSEMASSTRLPEQVKAVEQPVEKATPDEGLNYQRSKDAGTTCKERFSYSSFDAGATVKKTSPGAWNPTSILVENKDAYMLLECRTPNKFFIVELSDVILVDTVVIANFEFFSSNTRHFRVSISDSYPVKADKWKVLGTFEAQNMKGIQPFLIENPQDWARYLRIEILSHYGNEFYCPISLLRVHGLRMLDSWKQVDPSDLEGDDESPSEAIEQVAEVVEEQYLEPVAIEEDIPDNVTFVPEQSIWTPYWDKSYFEYTFVSENMSAQLDTSGLDSSSHGEDEQPDAPTTTNPAATTLNEQASSIASSTSFNTSTGEQTAKVLGEVSTTDSTTASALDKSTGSITNIPTITSSPIASPTSPASEETHADPTISQPSSEQMTTQSSSKSKTSIPTSMKPPSSRSSSKASSGTPTTPRNKTSTSTSAGIPSPTMQDSFFKALTKRLQVLESNTTLSLQYIEAQSTFLQEALAKLERKQIAKVDRFLDRLNNTMMNELRDMRTLYEQLWQSTVIALDTQREQTEREMVALSSRVGVLADSLGVLKTQVMVQSVLLLGCLVILVLVIFSPSVSSSAVESFYPRLASPIIPSTPPKNKSSQARENLETTYELNSSENTPVGSGSQYSTRTDANIGSKRVPGSQSSAGSKRADESDSEIRRPSTPNRALSDPVGLEYQPPTPSSMVDMAYDSEPTMTPVGDYFSANASINGDSSAINLPDGEDLASTSPSISRPEAPTVTGRSPSDVEGSQQHVMPLSSWPGRPGASHSGSTRSPLPALPEDPD